MLFIVTVSQEPNIHKHFITKCTTCVIGSVYKTSIQRPIYDHVPIRQLTISFPEASLRRNGLPVPASSKLAVHSRKTPE